MQRGNQVALIVVGMLSALAVLVPVALKAVDDVLDLDGCDGPGDWAAGVGDNTGSCALPFTGADVADGEVTFELQAQVGAEGWVATNYRFTNRTSEWRSIDSSKVQVVDSRGRTIDCYSDDSAVMVSSEPRLTATAVCGGAPDGQGGLYELVYDNVAVDAVDLRG